MSASQAILIRMALAHLKDWALHEFPHLMEEIQREFTNLEAQFPVPTIDLPLEMETDPSMEAWIDEVERRLHHLGVTLDLSDHQKVTLTLTDFRSL